MDFNLAGNNATEEQKADTSYFEKANEEGKATLEAQAERNERYKVSLNDTEYEGVIKILDGISDPKLKEDTKYKAAQAYKFSRFYGIPLDEAYQKVELNSRALFGPSHDTMTPKSRFEATCDAFEMGTQTLETGVIGLQLMAAELKGDKAEADKLRGYAKKKQEYSSELGKNMPEDVLSKIAIYGAQSLPFTATAIAASMVPVIGPAASFAFSASNMSGIEYLDARDMGASPAVAAGASALMGGLEGIIEVTLGNVASSAATLGKRSATELLRKSTIDKVTENIARKLHYSGGMRVITNSLMRYGEEILEEGAEEAAQEFVSMIGQNIIKEIEDLDVDGHTAREIWDNMKDSFVGGVYGSILLGSANFVGNSMAKAQDFQAIKELSENIGSEVAFKKAVSDSVVFEGMDDATKNKTIHEVFTNAQRNRNESIEATAGELEEVITAEDNIETFEPELDENGNEIVTDEPIPAEFRTEEGRLYNRFTENRENEDGTVSGTYVIGDGSKKDKNQYGYINYSIDEASNTVRIESFKLSKERQYLKNEMYSDFAERFSGYDIEWNPKKNLAKSWKAELEGLNPRGNKYGLNYFENKEAVSHADTRAKIARELRENLSSKRVSNKMIAPLVAEFEALGNFAGLNVSDFYNQVFGGRIFGDVKKAQEAALAQGTGSIRGGISIQNRNDTIQGLRAVVYAAENADFSTFSHELAHLGRTMIELQGGELAEKMNRAFDIGEAGWTVEKEEQFAEGFEDYLHTGKAANNELKELFQKLAQFLADTYHKLTNAITLSDDVKEVYDSLLKGDDSILKAAEAAIRNLGNEQDTVSDSMKKDTVQKESGKVTSEENLKSANAEETVNEVTENETENEKEYTGPDAEYNRVTDEAVESIVSDDTLTEGEKQDAVLKAAGEKLEAERARADILDYVKEHYSDSDYNFLSNWTTSQLQDWEAEIRGNNKLDDFLPLFQNIGEKGEVESRNVETRAGLSVEERRRQLLKDTEDVVREEQLILFQSKKNAYNETDFFEFGVGEYGREYMQKSDSPYQAALFLLNKKSGFIRNAFKNTPFGNVGLVYGDSEKGIYHIILKHIIDMDDFESIEEAINVIDDVLRNGTEEPLSNSKKEKLARGANVNPSIVKGNYRIILGKNEKGDFIISAFDYSRKENMKKRTEGNPTRFDREAFIKDGTLVPGTSIPSKDNTQSGNSSSTKFLAQRMDSKGNILFQTSDEKTLAGIHNLSEENLQHVVKMGGLANPSMAVIDVSRQTFDNFGGITLVAPKTLIAKDMGDNAGTFGADIYSPRYPTVTREVTPTGRKKIKSIFWAVEDDNLKNQLIDNTVQKFENGRKPDFVYTKLPIAYLAEKGNKDFWKYENSKYSDEIKDQIKSLKSDNVEDPDTAKVLKSVHEKIFKGDLEKQIKEYEVKLQDETLKPFRKNILKDNLEKAKARLELAEGMIKEDTDPDTGLLFYGPAQRLLDDIQRDIDTIGTIDEYKTENAAREIVKDDPEFIKWANEKYNNVEVNEKLFAGFTPSGNRKYLPHTLENVSKMMKKEATRGGESFSYGMGSTRARVAPKWTTLPQISKNKDRLVTKEEFESIKERLEPIYDNFIEELGGFDMGEARLNEALESANPLQYIEREYGIELDKEAFTDFVKELKAMPTEYFETKFNRPVYLNEFFGAVIPKGTSEETRKILEDAGLQISEYEEESQRINTVYEMGKLSDGQILFQKDDVFNMATQFDSWEEFKAFYETMGKDEYIPDEADNTWYRDVWEQANNISPTTLEREAQAEKALQKAAEETRREPALLDADFINYISKENNLESFMKIAQNYLDIDTSEWQAMTAEEEQERARYDELISRIQNTMSHRRFTSNMLRLKGGKELTPETRQALLSIIKGNARRYRALFAEITGKREYAVSESEMLQDASLAARRSQKYETLKIDADEYAKLSPEKQKQHLEKIHNAEIKDKFSKGKIKMDDPELEEYINLLKAENKNLRKDLVNLEEEVRDDYNRLGTDIERKIISEYRKFLNAKSEAEGRNIRLPRGTEKAIKIGEEAERRAKVKGFNTSYNTIFDDAAKLREEIEANSRIQERLRAENKLEELKEQIKKNYDARKVKNAMAKADSLNAMAKEYRQKKAEYQAVRELKDVRKKLVKAAMRNVDFKNVDFEAGKNILAVQRVFEPNLRGGVNKWIGRENQLAEEIWLSHNTDQKAREKIEEKLQKTGHTELIKKLNDTRSIEDFEDNWSKKEKASLEKASPKQDWIKDLGLIRGKEAREGALQLDIHEVQVERWETTPSGKKKLVYVTVPEFSDEIRNILIDNLGGKITSRIIHKPFADWTTEEMRELAERIDRMYKDGRNKLEAKREAERIEADRMRDRLLKAVRDTGVQINPDDPEDVKKKKQAKIDKILGRRKELAGTAAGEAEKKHSFLDRVLHGYHDANVRRVGRMLDNLSEGDFTNLLYWREYDCFNTESRNKDRRTEKVESAMVKAGIKPEELAKTVKVNLSGLGEVTFTIDELLMMRAAQKNQAEYFKEQLEEDEDLKAIFDHEPALAEKLAKRESGYQAITCGNMIRADERDVYKNIDAEIIEREDVRKDKLHNATLAGDEEGIKKYSAVAPDTYDSNDRLILYGSQELKSLGESRMAQALSAVDLKKYEPLVDAIRADYSKEFDRMNRVSIDEFNAPVWREKWYIPLIRLDVTGDTHEARLKADLLGNSAGTGAAGTEKGFTKKRVQIGPTNQAPVELGLYKTWADSVDRTEHFIAYAGYIRDLNRVFLGRQSGTLKLQIQDRYGKQMYDYLDSYIKEVANPQNREPTKPLDKVMRIMRGNTAPAYLGWKLSSIIKQGIESPAPFMQFVNPVEYLHACIDLAKSSEIRDSISEKSAFMKSRVFDPMVDIINENVEKSFNKKNYLLRKFQQKGMSGLEWIDWACVAPGWLAAYTKEYNRLQNMSESLYEERLAELRENNIGRTGNMKLTEDQLAQSAADDVAQNIEEEAVRKADDIVRLCQPSNRNADLSPMFKNNSEAAKAVLQFQTALNVIWQNIRYDIPYALKNHEYKNVVGMVTGYVMAGIMSGLVVEGLGGDDDEPEDKAKKTAYFATTQFLDSIPIVGSQIDGLAKKAITGEGAGFYSSSLWSTFDKYYNSAKALTDGDYKKMAKNLEQGLALSLGLPLSGAKELEAAIGYGDGDGELELNPGALVGRRK